MAELLQREQLYTPLWQQIGNHLNLHRWAGLSGALAVIMAAYGAHGHQFKGDKQTFISGNQMHFFHTLVLLALPLARRPSFVRASPFFFFPKFQNNNNNLLYIFVFSRAHYFYLAFYFLAEDAIFGH